MKNEGLFPDSSHNKNDFSTNFLLASSHFLVQNKKDMRLSWKFLRKKTEVHRNIKTKNISILFQL